MFDVRLYMASVRTQLQDHMVVLVTLLQSLMGIPLASMSWLLRKQCDYNAHDGSSVPCCDMVGQD